MLLAFLGLEIGSWVSTGGVAFVLGLIATFLRKKGYMKSVKFWTKKLSVITQEVGEAFLETSDVLSVLDKSINENDKFKESNVKEILAEGKEAVAEWKDVIITIKPK